MTVEVVERLEFKLALESEADGARGTLTGAAEDEAAEE